MTALTPVRLDDDDLPKVLNLAGTGAIAAALVRDAVEVAPKNAQAWFMKGTLADSLGDSLWQLQRLARLHLFTRWPRRIPPGSV